VEEADLGSWKKLQVDVLKKYQSKNEVVILTTGTNIDRATALWKLDFITYRTYVDLLFCVKCDLRKQRLISPRDNLVAIQIRVICLPRSITKLLLHQ
jgi:hypothetical protein